MRTTGFITFAQPLLSCRMRLFTDYNAEEAEKLHKSAAQSARSVLSDDKPW